MKKLLIVLLLNFLITGCASSLKRSPDNLSSIEVIGKECLVVEKTRDFNIPNELKKDLCKINFKGKESHISSIIIYRVGYSITYIPDNIVKILISEKKLLKTFFTKNPTVEYIVYTTESIEYNFYDGSSVIKHFTE